MAERMDILVGMAREIWNIATSRVHRRLSSAMLEKGAPAKAARALADLYENANDASLQEMFEGAKGRTIDAEEFGFELARAAVPRRGSPSSMTLSILRTLQELQIVVPTLTVSLEGDELVWEGDADDDDEGTPVFDVEGFPRTGHRLVKPNQDPENNPSAQPRGWHVGRTVTTVAQNVATIGVDGVNMLHRYVGVEVDGVGYGWLVEALDNGMVTVELADGTQGDYYADRVWPVAGRYPDHKSRSRNPAGAFTAKGERMYEDIKASYEDRGDPRAAELASRTVYARAADGVAGLVVRHGKPPGVPNGKRLSNHEISLLLRAIDFELEHIDTSKRGEMIADMYQETRRKLVRGEPTKHEDRELLVRAIDFELEHIDTSKRGEMIAGEYKALRKKL